MDRGYDQGRLVVVEEKHALLRRYGGRTFRFVLGAPVAVVPPALAALGRASKAGGAELAFEAEGSVLLGPALRAAEEAGLR